MRLAAYTGVSVTLATAVILKALHQRSNFYSVSVYLSQSNANLMILTNLCLLAVGFVLFGLQRLLYGRLRQIETEQLYEKAWFAVTETCLAMTIFRGELGAWFLVMFVCLLVGKIWGWIGEGRLEVLEQQPPNNPRLFHSRLALSLTLSVLFNAYMLNYAVVTVLRQARPDMMVMFGFEFAVLTILSTSTAARYCISLAEIYIVHQQKQAKLTERRTEIRAEREQIIRQRETSGSEEPGLGDLPNEDDIDEMELDVPGWEEKGRWVFYLDLVTDFLKLVVYLSFFAILFTFYGLPIHILRDVVLTMRSFAKRILDFLRYRNATRDMNERYPDATQEEIAREDVCIICREEMRPWQPPPLPNDETEASRRGPVVSERLRPKKLPCGHLLHFSCLRSWLERQQNCPTCRQPVTAPAQTGVFGGTGLGEQGMQGGGVGADNVGGEGRPRVWVLNLGLVRIGFGAGRGEILPTLNLNQGQGVPPPANQDPLAGPGVQNPRVGFGFGIGRAPPRATQTPAVPLGISNEEASAQLRQLEQRINQEITQLRNTSEQLQLVGLIQAELARLRAVQTAAQATPVNRTTTTPSGTTITSTLPGSAQPNAQPTPSSRGRNTASRSISSYLQYTNIPAGDPRLPEGLTLPPGWRLMPLRPQPSSSTADAQAQSSSIDINIETNPSSSPTTEAPVPYNRQSSDTTASTLDSPPSVSSDFFRPSAQYRVNQPDREPGPSSLTPDNSSQPEALGSGTSDQHEQFPIFSSLDSTQGAATAEHLPDNESDTSLDGIWASNPEDQDDSYSKGKERATVEDVDDENGV
ncbi:E3 ubiquitin-protein ligase hrd1 [Myotisia sp. PD_48]|nr:E3 ubiquitin-protein ligase hrd1 [Myotisia sp. PD_48]